MSKKKILVVVGSLNRGGTEGHVVQIFSRLDREKYDVIVYATSHKGALAPLLEKNGIRVVSPSFGRRLGKYPMYFFSSLKLIFFMIRFRPSIVHCFLPGAYLMGGICSVFVGHQRLVMSRRGLNYYQMKHPFLSKVEKWLHKKTKLIIGNSKAVNKQLLAEGVPPDKLALVYNGVDFHKFKVERDEHLFTKLEIHPNAFVMIIVANLFKYKGHVDLLHALSEIKNKLPNHWVLLCVGKDVEIGRRLRKLSLQLGLSSHIKWLGECSNIPSLLSLSTVGILSSHEEGFSNSILESMAAGLPMIVTDVGGNAEAVIHEVNGLVVPPKNPTKLAEAIMLLSENSALRERMSFAAKERAEKYFSLEKCVEKYEMKYADLLGTE